MVTREQVRRCQDTERFRVEAQRNRARLEAAPAVWLPSAWVSYERGEQRPAARRTTSTVSSKDPDPHIGGAPPAAVGNSLAALGGSHV